uniref:Secreted protein n=1 Tax=Panagrellus redivivus TaxID=6233 RepID=A0A7E5A1R0_PANRE
MLCNWVLFVGFGILFEVVMPRGHEFDFGYPIVTHVAIVSLNGTHGVNLEEVSFILVESRLFADGTFAKSMDQSMPVQKKLLFL